MNLIPVILSGGTGTRLWPLSLPHEPKQFLALNTEHSLIQESVLRLNGLDGVSAPVFVCNEAHRFLIAEHARQIDCQPLAILLEPVGRNTAPAIAVAALRALETDADAVLLVMPSDHLIQDTGAFHRSIDEALPHAGNGRLMTFGLVPQAPKTGYGYIQRGGAMTGENTFEVARFVEKPDADTAEGYLASGDYFWNSGIFLFRADAFISELEAHEPAMLAACREALEKGHDEGDFFRLEASAFERSPSNSIDYAVMEKTAQAGLVTVNMGWSDVGSWQSVWETGTKDTHGNVVVEQGKSRSVMLENARDCLVYSTNEGNDRDIALVGVSDLIVVDTGEALLVCHREAEQQVRVIAQDAADPMTTRADVAGG